MIAHRERLLFKIFHDYYVRNLSQAEIASRHLVSRQKVQRYLEQGRNRNLVEVRIKFPDRMHGALESELEDKFGLLEAMVADVDDGYSEDMVLRNIAELSSDYLLRVLHNDMTLSVAWSTSVSEMMDMAAIKAAGLRERPKNLAIVLTLGTVVGADPDLQTLDAARRLSGALAGDLNIILAPGITSSSQAWHALMEDPKVAEAVRKAKSADATFFGIGSMRGRSKLLQLLPNILPGLLPRLPALGVVGDMNGRFFDRDGNAVATELDERLIGLSLPDIKALPLAVGIVSGAQKYDALRGALAGKLFKVLVTDLDNAKRLVAEKS